MLSPNFQQQLEARLPPRRLHKKQRQFLMAYTLTALAVSVGALQLMGFSIGLTLLCVLEPLGIVATTLWRHLLQHHGTR